PRGAAQSAQVPGAAAGAGGSPQRERAIGVEDAHAVDIDARILHAVAAHREALAFAIVAAIERDARHARDRFADVLIGKTADIVGGDGIHRGCARARAIDRGTLRV